MKRPLDISILLDVRIWPVYIAASSAIVLAVHALCSSRFVQRTQSSKSHAISHSPNHQNIKMPETCVSNATGDNTIFFCKLARLGGVLVLTGLVIYAGVHTHTTVDLITMISLVYVSTLALLNVLASAKASLVYSFHLTLVTLAVFVPYAYRDVWPLMTLTLRPADKEQGVLLWTKIILLAFVSVIEPLFEPYPYVPVDPKEPIPTPNPEQTASVASFLLYTFLDPLVWLAYRIPHLKHDQLPPLSDYDYTKNLIKRSYGYLDPFSGAKKANLAWGLLVIFRRSLSIQALLLILVALFRLASPVAMKGLLSYIERGGQDSPVRPWVWICLMTAAPILRSMAWELYIFYSTGTLARIRCIFTALIFDHALRIRLKAEVSSDDEHTGSMDDTSVTVNKGASSEAAVEETGSPRDGSGDSELADESDEITVQSRSTTDATAASASVSLVTADNASPKSKGAQTSQDKKEQEPNSDSHKKGSNLIGKINNLMTSDLENIVDGRDFMFCTVSAPIQIVLAMGFLYSILGWSAFVGLGVMVVLFPAPTLLAKAMHGVQKQKMDASDARVQSVTEMMNILRMVKLFGWEIRIRNRIAEKREHELSMVWKFYVICLWNMMTTHTIPLLHMVATYTTYTLFMGRSLDASTVFSSMSAFQMLRSQIYMIFGWFPSIISAHVSLGRVANFLQEAELLDEFDPKPVDNVSANGSAEHADDIGMSYANFTWTSEPTDGTITPSRQPFRLRIQDDLLFKRGKFNLIIGPTGSGKTSLLMALLGEMHYIPLGPESWANLPRAGGVAYAAQESWVQNETIRANILFGAPYIEERYNKVIYQCGLKRDLSLFEAGDATEVGEKGITLSGGQKARVTLARAVYSSADILLLDDILAALDVHTARWIIDKCFQGDVIKGRTILLVTHNVALASPVADFVVSLSIDGCIATQGTISDALAVRPELAEEVMNEEKAIELDKTEDEVAELTLSEPRANGKLIVAEEIEEGHVSKDAFMLYLDALGGKWPISFWLQFLISMGLSEVFDCLEVWWLGYWARQYSLHHASEVSVPYYLSMYGLIVLCVIISFVCSILTFSYAAIRASRIIHAKLISSLLGSTFRWLDVTPGSRVITRCTQDVQAVDSEVPSNMSELTRTTLSMLACLGGVVLFIPAYLVPAMVIATLGGWLGQVYTKAQISVKRELSNAKAPVLGIVGSTLAGLPSIRAYHAQGAVREELATRSDHYMRAARVFFNLNRWISMRIGILAASFSGGLAFYLVYGGLSYTSATIGFVLNMAGLFSESILHWVRTYNDFEVSGNSLERIKQYVTIEQEPEPKDGGVPPAYWPSSGRLTAEKLSAQYSPDGPKVLQDVSFQINAGERIGIVGRTGAGKSTLTLALLRCIYTEGNVYYDGLPTDSLNLDALRSNITIIPQVPELLSGSLRQNLDIFGQYDDATLNNALRAAGLFSLQQMADENRLTLDSQISSGGGNLSVGQRQIIALARAIVRQSKLLILDEATSAIDYETDSVIQSSLRNELNDDVTVITVAHRLQTIMDSDKIMVFDSGRLIEFDNPKALLQNERGLLRALVDEGADKDNLYAIAEKTP